MVLCELTLLSVAVSACADGADECSYLGLYKVSFRPYSYLFFSVSAHIVFLTSGASQSLSHKLQRCSPLDLEPLFCNTAVTYSPQNLWPQTQTFFYSYVFVFALIISQTVSLPWRTNHDKANQTNHLKYVFHHSMVQQTTGLIVSVNVVSPVAVL